MIPSKIPKYIYKVKNSFFLKKKKQTFLTDCVSRPEPQLSQKKKKRMSVLSRIKHLTQTVPKQQSPAAEQNIYVAQWLCCSSVCASMEQTDFSCRSLSHCVQLTSLKPWDTLELLGTMQSDIDDAVSKSSPSFTFLVITN